MGVIVIDYETITLVTVLLFAAVGFMRGWLKEVITTLLLILLTALLYRPELVTPIMKGINQVLNIILTAISNIPTLDVNEVARAGPRQDVLTPENPYTFLLWSLIFLIALSYLTGSRAIKDQALTPMSRILGGLAGAINGFIAISLFKEYLLGYFQNLTVEQQAGKASLQAGAPPAGGFSVAVQNVPQEPFMESVGPVVLVMVAVVIGLVILSRVFKWQIK